MIVGLRKVKVVTVDVVVAIGYISKLAKWIEVHVLGIIAYVALLQKTTLWEMAIQKYV